MGRTAHKKASDDSGDERTKRAKRGGKAPRASIVKAYKRKQQVFARQKEAEADRQGGLKNSRNRGYLYEPRVTRNTAKQKATVQQEDVQDLEREDNDEVDDEPEVEEQEAEEEVLDGEEGEEEDGNDESSNSTDQRHVERTGETHITFRKGKGTAHRVRWNCTKVQIRYTVVTSVECPCEDSKCVSKVKVGTFGVCGDGRMSCPHCLSVRGKGNYFRSASDVKRHIQSARCKKKRGVKDDHMSARERLGRTLAYELGHPDNMFIGLKDGKERQCFKCPKCDQVCTWPHRFMHCVKCYPEHGVQIGDRAGGQGREGASRVDDKVVEVEVELEGEDSDGEERDYSFDG